MLQHRVRSWTQPWCSSRSASQLSQSPASQVTKTTPPRTLLSRLSDRSKSKTREQKSPDAHVQREPRPPATSFVSTRSAQQRDRGAEKWFKDIRKLDIDDVGQSSGFQPLLQEQRRGQEYPKKHQLRPKTGLDGLFAPPTLRSAASLRLQTKKEQGGDYASYLPDRYADPRNLPLGYARLALGRNKHISLTAQNGALNVIEEAIFGRTTKQDRAI